MASFNARTLFSIGGGGNIFSDPRMLPRYTPFAFTLPETDFTNAGVLDDTNWSNGVYKTIGGSALTGPGYFFFAAGPNHTGGVTTMRITVDGTAYTIAFSAVSTQRAILGPIIGPTSFAPVEEEMLADGDRNSAAQYSGLDIISGGSAYGTDWAFPSGFMCEMMNLPRVFFNTSLLVEMKHADDITDVTNRKSGFAYRLIA